MASPRQTSSARVNLTSRSRPGAPPCTAAPPTPPAAVLREPRRQGGHRDQDEAQALQPADAQRQRGPFPGVVLRQIRGHDGLDPEISPLVAAMDTASRYTTGIPRTRVRLHTTIRVTMIPTLNSNVIPNSDQKLPVDAARPAAVLGLPLSHPSGSR